MKNARRLKYKLSYKPARNFGSLVHDYVWVRKTAQFAFSKLPVLPVFETWEKQDQNVDFGFNIR